MNETWLMLTSSSHRRGTALELVERGFDGRSEPGDRAFDPPCAVEPQPGFFLSGFCEAAALLDRSLEDLEGTAHFTDFVLPGAIGNFDIGLAIRDPAHAAREMRERLADRAADNEDHRH